MRKSVALTSAVFAAFIASAAAPLLAATISYEFTGAFNLAFGPDPFSLNGKTFRATMFINNLVPDSLTPPHRVDYSPEVGTLTLNGAVATVTEAFAIFRDDEAPFADVMDLGYRTPAGDLFFAIRHPAGSNGTVPPPPTFSGIPILNTSSALLAINFNPLDNTSYSISNAQFIATIPEPSSLVLACLGLISLVVFGWRRKR